MQVFKISSSKEISQGSRLEMEMIHDLENLCFLSQRQASDYILHLRADDPEGAFELKEEKFNGIHDAAEKRVYLRQGPKIVAYYASRLGFIDLREMILVRPEEMRAEIKEQWDAVLKAS